MKLHQTDGVAAKVANLKLWNFRRKERKAPASKFYATLPCLYRHLSSIATLPSCQRITSSAGALPLLRKFFGRVENRLLEFCKFIFVRCWLTNLTLLVPYSIVVSQLLKSYCLFYISFCILNSILHVLSFVLLYFCNSLPWHPVYWLSHLLQWCCCHFSHHLLSTLEASNRFGCHKSFHFHFHFCFHFHFSPSVHIGSIK